MQFLSLYTPAAAPSGPPSAEHMAKMGALMETMTKKGALIATGGLGRSDDAFKLTLKSGKLSAADGPFTDVFAKASGWALMEANSREELTPLIRQFLDVAGDGECEIMPVFGGPPPG
jgi:hypothetical protein